MQAGDPGDESALVGRLSSSSSSSSIHSLLIHMSFFLESLWDWKCDLNGESTHICKSPLGSAGFWKLVDSTG